MLRTDEDIGYSPLTSLLHEVFLYFRPILSFVKSVTASMMDQRGLRTGILLYDYSGDIRELGLEHLLCSSAETAVCFREQGYGVLCNGGLCTTSSTQSSELHQKWLTSTTALTDCDMLVWIQRCRPQRPSFYTPSSQPWRMIEHLRNRMM